MTEKDTARRQPGGAIWTTTPTGVSVPEYHTTPTATGQPAWVQSKAWADSFWPAIQQVILGEALPKMARLTVGGPADDQKHCTDYVLAVQPGRIACRVRSSRYWRYADLTLRLSRRNGAETEVAKLREGYVDWYFAGWGDDGQLTAWALIDVDRMLPLLDQPRKVYTNHTDGVQFVAVSLAELAQAGAVSAAGGLAAGYAKSERT